MSDDHEKERAEAQEYLRQRVAHAEAQLETRQWLAEQAEKAQAATGEEHKDAARGEWDDGAGGGAGGDYGAGYEGEGGVGGAGDSYYEAGMRTAGGTADPDAPTGFAWSRPVMTGVPPPARGGHAAGLVGNLLIVCGGHYYGGSSTFKYLDDVWAVDVDTMTWHNPTCAGGGPSARYGHTATVIGYKLYVFGGRGPKGVLYNDMWCLDVETWTWDRMSSTTAPPLGRFGHSALLVGTKIVYFGGWDGSKPFNDLWVYDTEAFCWIKPKVAGPKPAARYGHLSALSRDGRIIIFGGATVDEKGRPSYLSDVKQLDTETMVWRRCRVTGDHPSARANMSGCDVANTLTFYGGWNGIKKSIVPDSAIVRTKERPSSSDPRGTTNPHLFMLDLAAMEWTQPKSAGTQPSKRYGHSVTPVGSKLLMFGGWDGNRPLNDIVQLEAAPLFDL